MEHSTGGSGHAELNLCVDGRQHVSPHFRVVETRLNAIPSRAGGASRISADDTVGRFRCSLVLARPSLVDLM